MAETEPLFNAWWRRSRRVRTRLWGWFRFRLWFRWYARDSIARYEQQSRIRNRKAR